MKPFPESELVLNADHSVYHLSLSPEHISDTIIVVGDPGRVHKVTQHFDSVDFEMNKREFITQTGICNNKRITVISSGIGTDNVEIVMNELDALVNIDLKTRLVKERLRRLRIIRIGTSGSIQENIPVGSQVVSAHAVGLDTLMAFYALSQTPEEIHITQQLQEELHLPFQPYCISASPEMVKQFGFDMIQGNTVTCPGFYSPQGRTLRCESRVSKLIEKLNYFHANDFWLTNLEMETAGYYAFGRLMNHEMVSINAILANRITHQFAKNPDKVVDEVIEKVLSRI